MRDGDQLSLTRCGCSMRAWFHLNRFGAFGCSSLLVWQRLDLWLQYPSICFKTLGVACSMVTERALELPSRIRSLLGEEAAAPICGLIARPR